MDSLRKNVAISKIGNWKLDAVSFHHWLFTCTFWAVSYLCCAKVMSLILLGANLFDLKSNFCSLSPSLFFTKTFFTIRTSPYLIRRLLNNCQWSVLCQSSIIMRTYSSIIFAIINTVATVVAKKYILLSAHQKNDRWWCTERPAPFVKRMRYLIYIYAIPINNYVLLKRQMVFIYFPCSR